MKNLQVFSTVSLSLTMLLLLAACGESADPVGGEKGEIGPQGAQGPAGQNGAQGPAGTANVIYSDWYGPNFGGGTIWSGLTTADGRLVNSFYKTATPITTNVISQGVVLVYARLGLYGSTYGLSETSTVLLPVTGTATRSGVVQTETWSAAIFSGRVDITFQNSANFWQTGAMGSGYRFRYVIIPGGVASGRKERVDYADYEAVKRAFNLPD